MLMEGLVGDHRAHRRARDAAGGLRRDQHRSRKSPSSRPADTHGEGLARSRDELAGARAGAHRARSRLCSVSAAARTRRCLAGKKVQASKVLALSNPRSRRSAITSIATEPSATSLDDADFARLGVHVKELPALSRDGRRGGGGAHRRRRVARGRHGARLRGPARDEDAARVLVPLRDHVRGAVHPHDDRHRHAHRALPDAGVPRPRLAASSARPTSMPGRDRSRRRSSSPAGRYFILTGIDRHHLAHVRHRQPAPRVDRACVATTMLLREAKKRPTRWSRSPRCLRRHDHDHRGDPRRINGSIVPMLASPRRTRWASSTPRSPFSCSRRRRDLDRQRRSLGVTLRRSAGRPASRLRHERLVSCRPGRSWRLLTLVDGPRGDRLRSLRNAIRAGTLRSPSWFRRSRRIGLCATDGGARRDLDRQRDLDTTLLGLSAI